MINGGIKKDSIQLQRQNTQAASIQQEKAALNCEIKDILKTLSVGDKLLGEVIINSQQELVLKLSNDILLPVTTKEHVPLNKLLTFLIISNEKMHIEIKPVNEGNESILSDKVIDNLSLPKNDTMTECIKQFINDERPLDRVELLKTYHLVQKMHIPLPVILKIGDKLGINQHQFFENLHKAIDYSAEKQVYTVGQYLFEDGELGIQEKVNNSIIFLGQYIEQEESINLPSILREELLDVLENKNTKMHVLNEQADLVTGRAKQSDYFLCMNYLKDALSDRESSISQLLKVVVFIKELYTKEFTISDKDRLRQENGLKDSPLCRTSERLVQLLKEIEAFSVSTKGKESLQEVREAAQVWQKMNEIGEYYHYPMFFNHQKQEAEVYFFKPYNKNKKNNKDFYAVIALDFPSIKHIDVHIHQIESNIMIRIEVESEQIQKCFNQMANELLEKVKCKGYYIQSYVCELKRQNTSLDNLLSTVIEKGINIQV